MREEQYCEIWKSRLEEKDKDIEQLRSIKHDMQAHWIVLQYYLDSEKYDEAKRYLKDLRQQAETLKKRLEVDTGNVLIDALVEEYVNRSDEIRFCCEGKFEERTGLSEFEMCVLFSNLISNAVEACEKLTKSPKEIYMSMKKVGNFFEIRVKNYIEWEIDIARLGQGTTKSDTDNHGYGIKNLKNIVELHNGNINFQILEGSFEVHVCLPIVGNGV